VRASLYDANGKGERLQDRRRISCVIVVSDFAKRILRGEETSPEEWEAHLRDYHRRLSGGTSAVFSRVATERGQTSYEVLAGTAITAAEGLDRPVDVLDLACGDGHLIELCLRELRGRITITGVDMSEDELDLARQRLVRQDARLRVGLAESLPLPADSVDVALCHLAFMLMVPVEPIVAELARVLRSGGGFSAVVASSAISTTPRTPSDAQRDRERALWEKVSAALRQFWQEEYPHLRTEGRVGDPRAMTEDGWKELFREETGYTGDVEVQEFEIVVRESAEGIWAFLKDTYLVDMLDATMRAELRNRLMAVIMEHQRAHRTLDMAFPLRKLSVRTK
jgi:ubiquinone/menaquinone biosynthesis C-methylase UbiE